MADGKYLLTDEQMQHFIVNGYIHIKTDLPLIFTRRFSSRRKRCLRRKVTQGTT